MAKIKKAISIVFILAVVLLVYYWQPRIEITESLTPSQTVENFYGEWLAYPGESPTKNPMADKIYRMSEYVTEKLVQRLDNNILDGQASDYDRVLCGQEMPEKIEFRESFVKEEEAEIIVVKYFLGQSREIKVSLKLTEGEWKIDRITCPAVDAASASQLPNPASVNCAEQGGNLEIRTEADGGQRGFCVFSDGSECEEWQFFRGECEKGSIFCKDLCGDGICQEIVCLAVGCPCSETPETCPKDCQ
jgi:putative hemolysin